jgi:ABC-type multidrug transport system fused ATPase/permease subunit
MGPHSIIFLDHRTDAVIQASLRNELGSDVTILTVAHRLQTIMDSDKIVSHGYLP